MGPQNWERVKDVFQVALERSPEERVAYLRELQASDPELYREIESLLRHHADTQGLPGVENLLDAGLLHAELPNPWLGRDIGPYRVVSVLGEGGMGAVYQAIRIDDHYLKNVAIKVVRTGFATRPYLRRFRSERQILATLDHPNIAHLLDGGATSEGLPYLVMEFIEGKPIDEYCDTNALTTTQRLQLFLQVCSAVEYAHQKLIIHRDLKPANILVTAEGTPKLLDFGIAKLVDPELYLQSAAIEGTVMRAMTPEFASPEQARGLLITTASDVYSLGVVLYRLLTGHPPYTLPVANAMDWSRVITEVQPERPSVVIERTSEITDASGKPTCRAPDEIAAVRDGRLHLLRRNLRGDLDNIVLKALRKDPARRYASVEQFANDIRRSLEGLPVSARPDTFTYRAAKFAGRNKVPVAAVALVLLSLTAGFFVALRQAHIAEEQRALAERRFNDIRAVSHDLIFDVHDSIQYLAGATPARKLIVQDALRYLNALTKEGNVSMELQNEIATAYEKIGDAQGGTGRANLGDTAGALESYSKAISIRKAILESHPSDNSARDGLARSYKSLGEILQDMGRFQEALKYHQAHLDLSKQLAAASPADTRAQSRLAASYDGMGDIQASLTRLDDSLISYEAGSFIYKSLSAAHPDQERYRSNWALERKKIGGVYEAKGKLDRALQEYRSALLIDAQLAKTHPQDASAQRDVSIDHSNLGDAILKSGDPAHAIQEYRQALAIDTQLANADPKDASARYYLVYDGYRLGDAQLKNEDPQAALASYRTAAQRAEQNASSDPENALMRSELARVYSKLARAHFDSVTHTESPAPEKKARLSAARTWYRKSLAIWLDLRGRGALQGADTHEPDRVADELSQCTAALSRDS